MSAVIFLDFMLEHLVDKVVPTVTKIAELMGWSSP
jgi:hypothetical protein